MAKDGMKQQVPCGVCMLCRKRRISTWAFRLYTELRNSDNAAMYTMTYAQNPISPNGYPTLSKRDIQLFFKRARKLGDPSGSKSLRKGLKYYVAGEYGELFGRPHYHAMIFNLNPLQSELLEETWKHGHIHKAPLNMATIHYSLKYLNKGRWIQKDDTKDVEREFQLMSKGLGKDYLSPAMIKHHQDLLKGYVELPSGQKLPLPRYYKERIFSPDQRELLNEQFKQLADERQQIFIDNPEKEIVWKNELIRKAHKKSPSYSKLAIATSSKLTSYPVEQSPTWQSAFDKC